MLGHSHPTKQQRNDVAEAKKRRSNAKSEVDIGGGRSATPTVWPCQINGCTKTFVREADLKRHQKTTKTHSNPSFRCEDCNARFTRTDALRRHRRSRHHANRELHVPRISSENSSSMSMTELRSARGSSLSEGSVRSRSLSPRPSQVKEREGRERDRRSREPLSSSDLTGDISRYPRYAYTDRRFHRSVSPHPPSPPLPSASPPPTCFRGQPTHSSSLNAILASPISTPRLQPVKWSIEHSDSFSGRTSPPPRLPPSLRGVSPPVTHSAKALSSSVESTLSPHRPLSHGLSPNRGKDARSAGINYGRVDASKKGHQPPVTPLSPPPPIVSAHPNSRSTPCFNFDSSGSDDEDEEEEFDELLPSSPEPELEDPEGPSYRIRSHRIPGIDTCIGPGITEEEVKVAMEAVLNSRREREQQKAFTDGLAKEKDTRGREDLRGGEIRMGSSADRDGLPFLSKASPSLSSSSLSSTTLVNDSHDVHSRYGLPDLHRKPGRGIYANSTRSSSPFINYHRDGHKQTENDEDEEEMDVLVDGSFSDMDTDERSNIKVYTSPVGREERAAATVRIKGGRLGKVKVHGTNELHEYDDEDEDNYGPYSPPLDRSHPQYLTYDLGETWFARNS